MRVRQLVARVYLRQLILVLFLGRCVYVQHFMQTDPLISEFIIEIRRFDDVDHEIEQIPDSQIVGSLELDFSQSTSLSISCFISCNWPLNHSGSDRVIGQVFAYVWVSRRLLLNYTAFDPLIRLLAFTDCLDMFQRSWSSVKVHGHMKKYCDFKCGLPSVTRVSPLMHLEFHKMQPTTPKNSVVVKLVADLCLLKQLNRSFFGTYLRGHIGCTLAPPGKYDLMIRSQPFYV